MRFFGIILSFCLILSFTKSRAWGFFGHKLITEWSVFALPDPLFNIYSAKITEIKEYSIVPDIIKNTEPKEYCKHYIDLEHVDSVEISAFNIDSCLNINECFDKGILPYIIIEEFNKLVQSFKSGNSQNILFQSGKLGHYVSDLCVPFHTTANYDGQLTNQEGIHALWESYLPEQFNKEFNIYGLEAKFEPNINKRIIEELYKAHNLVSPILDKHTNCINALSNNSYGFFERKNKIVKGYSQDFMDCFIKHTKSDIEEQMISSIQFTSDLWFTAWVYAGKPMIFDNNSEDTSIFINSFQINSSIIYNKRKHE